MVYVIKQKNIQDTLFGVRFIGSRCRSKEPKNSFQEFSVPLMYHELNVPVSVIGFGLRTHRYIDESRQVLLCFHRVSAGHEPK